MGTFRLYTLYKNDQSQKHLATFNHFLGGEGVCFTWESKCSKLDPRYWRKTAGPTFFNNRKFDEKLCFWFSKLPEIAWQLAQWQVNPLQVDWLDPTLGYNDEDGFFAKQLKLLKKPTFSWKPLTQIFRTCWFLRGFSWLVFLQLLGRLQQLLGIHCSKRRTHPFGHFEHQDDFIFSRGFPRATPKIWSKNPFQETPLPKKLRVSPIPFPAKKKQKAGLLVESLPLTPYVPHLFLPQIHESTTTHSLTSEPSFVNYMLRRLTVGSHPTSVE